MNYRPIFIIGAGRSGTNILRDTLISIEGWETWPCDEINLIWRHGNRLKRDDVFGSSEARPEVVQFLRSYFERFAAQSKAKVVLEKTCANTLRIPFIESVFPEARYINLVRDGRDVALSAEKRWKASVEMKYLLRKIPYVPVTDIPHYALRFAKNRFYQIKSKEKRQAAWGPIFPEMNEWVASRPLIEVCAKQWAFCVDQCDQTFAKIPAERLLQLKYEDLVRDPDESIGQILDWTKTDQSAFNFSQLQAIRPSSVDTWKKQQDCFTTEALNILSPVLNRHGYETAL